MAPVDNDRHAVPLGLTTALAVVMMIQSVLGLLLAEQYRDEEWIRATWFGNDAVTLIVATPLLTLATRGARRGSPRAVLLWLGLLGYAVYNYAFYLLGAALSVFFPLYVIAFVLAAIAIILALARVDVVRIADEISPALRFDWWADISCFWESVSASCGSPCGRLMCSQGCRRQSRPTPSNLWRRSIWR